MTTRREYTVQLLDGGKWTTCATLHWNTSQADEILADLDDARSKYPDETYRVGVRYIPEYQAAEETDPRLAVVTGGSLL